MKYKIFWRDIVDIDDFYTKQELTDNVVISDEELLKRLEQSLLGNNIKMISFENDCGFVNYGATHEFEAIDNEEAKIYAQKYDFGERRQNDFSITGENGFYWAQEAWLSNKEVL